MSALETRLSRKLSPQGKNTKDARRNAIHHRGTEDTEAAIIAGDSCVFVCVSSWWPAGASRRFPSALQVRTTRHRDHDRAADDEPAIDGPVAAPGHRGKRGPITVG